MNFLTFIAELTIVEKPQVPHQNFVLLAMRGIYLIWLTTITLLTLMITIGQEQLVYLSIRNVQYKT